MLRGISRQAVESHEFRSSDNVANGVSSDEFR
jgi:hypothetical protein